MKPAVAYLLIALAACQPSPGVTLAAPDASPAPAPAPGCPAACAAFRRAGCPEGVPSCEADCANAATVVNLPLACFSAGQTKADMQRCQPGACR